MMELVEDSGYALEERELVLPGKKVKRERKRLEGFREEEEEEPPKLDSPHSLTCVSEGMHALLSVAFFLMLLFRSVFNFDFDVVMFERLASMPISLAWSSVTCTSLIPSSSSMSLVSEDPDAGRIHEV